MKLAKHHSNIIWNLLLHVTFGSLSILPTYRELWQYLRLLLVRILLITRQLCTVVLIFARFLDFADISLSSQRFPFSLPLVYKQVVTPHCLIVFQQDADGVQIRDAIHRFSGDPDLTLDCQYMDDFSCAFATIDPSYQGNICVATFCTVLFLLKYYYFFTDLFKLSVALSDAGYDNYPLFRECGCVRATSYSDFTYHDNQNHQGELEATCLVLV